MQENLSGQEKKWFSIPILDTFHNLGWLAFWLQIVLAFIPISVLLFALFVFCEQTFDLPSDKKSLKPYFLLI